MRHLPAHSGLSGKITDPRKLLARRYQMMLLHLGLIIALIVVSGLEVRSATLLAIHSTSATLYLIYVPITAILTWRASRHGFDGKASAGRWARWDSAGTEVGYLAVQCGTTLASSVLCALTLSSTECFGPNAWALDEFGLIRERDARDWCHGVIGATVLSFVQFMLDLAWLGWIVAVVRAGSGVRSGDEGVELSRRASRLSRVGTNTPDQPGTAPAQQPRSSSTIGRNPAGGTGTAGAEGQLHPSPHTQHLFQTLLMPTPALLIALAERRSAALIDQRRRVTQDARERMRRGQFAPTLEERAESAVSSSSGDRTLVPVDLETGDHAPGVLEVPPPYHGLGKAPDYPGLGTRG